MLRPTVSTLRDYQTRAIEACRAQFALGKRAVCLQLPTGAGKTVVASHVVGAHVRRANCSVLFVVHRNELEEQAEAKFRSIGVTVGPLFATQIASVQGLIRREQLPEASLVIFDECHHLSSHNSWGALVPRFLERGSLVLGLTATPSRGDGRALSGFDALVVGVTPAELTSRGHLVPCDVIAPARGTELADPVAALLEYAPGRPAIVFCQTVAHSEDVAAKLRAQGVRAESIDGKMRTKNTLTPRLEAFKRGELDVLTSVHVLTEGFDATRAEVCVVARGCSAAITWIQMVGRVLRPHPGKSRSLVIDCMGSVYDHGLPTDERVWSLDGRQGRLAKALPPIRQCPQCGAVNRPAPQCPRCLFTFPVKPLPQAERKELSVVTEVDTFGPRAEKMFRGFQAIAAAKGYQAGWAAHMFKSKTGRWPPRQWGAA